MSFKDMTVGELKAHLNNWPDDRSICMTSRMQHGTRITAINFVGEDTHGNLVITLDDSLLKSNDRAETMTTKELKKKVDALRRMNARCSLCRQDAVFINKLLILARKGRKTSARMSLIFKLEDLHMIASSVNK